MNLISKKLFIPFIFIGLVYSVLGFTIGINAFLIPFTKQAFNVTTTMSYLIMTATFLGFIIFGTLSGSLVDKITYKSRIVFAFFVMALGFMVIVPAINLVSFPLLLLGFFISGLGRAFVVGAIHTYISIIGPLESATSRIAIMGITHKIFYGGASLVLSVFMDLIDVRLNDALLPLYIIAGVLFTMSILFYFVALPDIKAKGEDVEGEKESKETFYGNSKKNILHFPHLLLGVVAIFFAVGIDLITLGSINDFATRQNFSSPENFVWIVTSGMIIGSLFAVFYIPRYLSQDRALFIATLLGVFVTLCIVTVPVGISIYLVGLLGLANSMMIAIWPLALADLGNYTKRASSLLVIGFIGGAFFPILFGYIVDLKSFQFAYIILMPAYFYIMYYAVSGSKIRT